MECLRQASASSGAARRWIAAPHACFDIRHGDHASTSGEAGGSLYSDSAAAVPFVFSSQRLICPCVARAKGRAGQPSHRAPDAQGTPGRHPWEGLHTSSGACVHLTSISIVLSREETFSRSEGTMARWRDRQKDLFELARVKGPCHDMHEFTAGDDADVGRPSQTKRNRVSMPSRHSKSVWGAVYDAKTMG